MTSYDAYTAVLALFPVLVIFVVMRRLRGRKRPGGTRVRTGPGPGAAGAIHQLLNEDKRRAIEIIAEGRAEATDPEHADGTPAAGDDRRSRPNR
jgi:hypothetical protein